MPLEFIPKVAISTPGSKFGLLPNRLSGVRFSWKMTTTCLKVTVCAKAATLLSATNIKGRVLGRRVMEVLLGREDYRCEHQPRNKVAPKYSGPRYCQAVGGR